ncbi:MAG: hypothetical protein PHD41_05970 [Methanosarcinaceae archaeon]|nr:hypothetical protein [Methanosarcinaceae archaeon]MDD4332304.1 hypothetical protein [Methanosarcinaceae archaeon]
MTRCLFCGAHCELRCGVYCEGYPKSPKQEEKIRAKRLECTQIGTSYICDVCLAELREALGLN